MRVLDLFSGIGGFSLGLEQAGMKTVAFEPDMGRVAHGVSARVDRLKGLGNAVVPQIPELLGRAILAATASYSLSMGTDGDACTALSEI